MKKENIHVKGNLPIKSQELNPEDNQFRGFHELCGGKSAGYAVMTVLMPSSQNTDAVSDVVHSIGYLQHKCMHGQTISTVQTVTRPGRIQGHTELAAMMGPLRLVSSLQASVCSTSSDFGV